MHLQISLLLLFCLNIVHGGDGYFSERYQKQSSIKGPHFLPYNVKSQGKFTIFFQDELTQLFLEVHYMTKSSLLILMVFKFH